MAKDSKKKGLTINCNKTQRMVDGKRKRPTCELQIGDGNMKQKKIKYLGIVSTEDGNCANEILLYLLDVGISNSYFVSWAFFLLTIILSLTVDGLPVKSR